MAPRIVRFYPVSSRKRPLAMPQPYIRDRANRSSLSRPHIRIKLSTAAEEEPIVTLPAVRINRVSPMLSMKLTTQRSIKIG